MFIDNINVIIDIITWFTWLSTSMPYLIHNWLTTEDTDGTEETDEDSSEYDIGKNRTYFYYLECSD